ncbi:aminoglycoside phosphotransferase [Streptomyces sp. NPDC014733]|uniref:aminoglycoside phosphotransferase n=1 Tax=Streptomyces sp. NPDC014733 TaxID=3364885 RepID=UPI0036F4FB98
MPVQQTWNSLPADVHTAVRARTGAVHRADDIAAGYVSQLTTTLDTDSGRVFVKGLRHDYAFAWNQQREADIAPHAAPLAPAVRWRIDAGGWDLIGFEHLTGRGADYAPDSADLPLVVDALATLGGIRCPDVRTEDAVDRWARHLDDPADGAAFAGPTLLHTDLNPANVLIDGAAPARLVDWAYGTRGAAWIDPACWIVWLIHHGHPAAQAEQWAAEVPSWSTAPRRSLDLFATALSGYWQALATEYPNPITESLRDGAAAWARLRAES